MSLFEFTWHAKKRMAQMGVDVDEVTEVLNDPDLTRPGRTAERREYVAGRLIVVMDMAAMTVVTVLWRTYQEYSRPDTRPGSRYYGRPMAS